MKIKYVFANGEVKWVEVSDEVAAAITESRRLEENGDRKFRYHSYSLASCDFEGEEFAESDTPESLMIEGEEMDTIKLFMRTLTKIQCRRLRLKLGGLNLHQIALFEKADYKTIKECFSQIQKKFQTFFKNTPQK